MSKFARNAPATTPVAPVTTLSRTVPDTRTYQGAAGWLREPKGELFLLAVTNMVGEHTYYELIDDRDSRFRNLIHTVTQDDAGWVGRFILYLRDQLHMRTAPLVMAVEYGLAGGDDRRRAVDVACQRADEPAELLAYWHLRYGRREPKWLKRGLADACERLYSERAALRYDGEASDWRMADVLERCHPKGKGAPHPRYGNSQGALFRWLLDRRHQHVDPGGDYFALLRMAAARAVLDTTPITDRRSWMEAAGAADRLQLAGMSWEALSGWLQGPMDAHAWETIIPSMGYMALLRNLRNFDQAGVSDQVADQVCARLADPAEVARSRQLPIRFWSAYRHVDNDRWRPALNKAADLTLANIPALPGRTLVLVDVSPSMFPGWGGQMSSGARYEIAALFGAALAMRAEAATLVAYDSRSTVVDVPKGGSLLPMIGRLASCRDPMGGTATWQALRDRYQNHDRVVILTDEQSFPAHSMLVGGRYDRQYDPAGIVGDRPVYTFNLAGYQPGHLPSGIGNRFTFGGLTDAGFAAIAALEARQNADWPF